MKAILILIGICFLAPPATAQTTDIIPKKLVSAALAKTECVTTEDEAITDSAIFDVEGAVKLLVLPCIKAAYNMSSILLQIDASRPAEAKLLHLTDWSEEHNRWEKTTVLFNVEFNTRTKRLTTLTKYRGVGDCGSSGEYTWSGGRFILTAYWLKTKCDGRAFAPRPHWRVALPR